MSRVVLPTFASIGANDIVALKLQNAGAATLQGGVTTFGQVFEKGDLPKGGGLVAQINGQTVAVQVDVKTTYADGSAKMVVLSLERPDIAAGTALDVVLSHGTASAASAIDLAQAAGGHSFTVSMTPAGGATTTIDVLAALKTALANGTASFWQKGEFATEARISIDLPGSQRMIFDVTAYKGGGLSVDAQFNNDDAMQATGGRVNYTLTAQLDGKTVANETVNQAQYQNWHETFTTGTSGGQGLGSEKAGWLNIQHDTSYLQATGAVAPYNLAIGVDSSLLNGFDAANDAASWSAPLAANGVTQYMPATGGRGDIGITTQSNTAWLMTQDANAAAYALGQADAANAIPIHFWDAANGTWLNTDNYPKLWLDGRGGVGTPGASNSGTLVQGIAGNTGWTFDTAHQPDLSYVPYLMTGERWILDNVFAQASATIMNEWPAQRLNAADMLANGAQVRSAAWGLRQVDEAAWAAPEGSAEKAYFQAASNGNWKWLVSKIPEWTAKQGEAHGWVPGDYGVKGAMPEWQQDYFASTAAAAARAGNADALTFLKWEMNFLVGRFTHESSGFKMHDGVAYLIAISDQSTGAIYKTWAEIGAQTIARGYSNGNGWAKVDGNYAQVALASLSAIYELTGSQDALSAYKALVAAKPPFVDEATFSRDPTYSLAVPDSANTPPISNTPTAPVVTAPTPPTPTPPKPTPPTTTPPATTTTTIGSGSDALVLKISEDAYNGHAQYTIKVDGVQVGGVLTASASHALGQSDTVTVKGNWGSAAHKVEVSFLNDAWGGSSSTDRNLYVDSITYGGKAVPSSTVMIGKPETVAFTTPAAAVVPPLGGTSTTIGSGSDALVLKISEDAYNGHAQYTIKVDGVQVGGVLTASASHALGQSDTVTVKGNWGSAAHKVEVSFLNDAWGGSSSTDRNLYVDSITYGGKAVPSSTVMIGKPETVAFTTPAAAVVPPLGGTSTTIGSGSDALVLKISEDAYNGHAQYTIKVDGVQVGGVLTASASHALGQSDTVTVKGNWGSAAHKVEVNFLNDAWGGTSSTDRNLYVDSITYGDKAVPSSTLALKNSGAVQVSVPATAVGSTNPAAVNGKAAADLINGTAANDTLNGLAGNDTLLGGAGTDTLNGGDGNDSLDGGAGADQMTGGLGDDVFLVDHLGDIVIELAGGGYDRVVASVSGYTLGANVERLDLAGTTTTGIGNELGNLLVGNELNNILKGLGGDDQLYGNAGSDTLEGGAGRDTLFGGEGNDSLDGGAGDDLMLGGAGDDIYIVDSLGDFIVENAGEGYDRVVVNVSGFTLGANLERLDLAGSALSGTGSAQANVIYGNALGNLLNGMAGNDEIHGGAGRDTLIGGLGADTLEGGGGADLFRFASAAEGGDTILDFVHGTDALEISVAGFGGKLALNTDVATRFISNTTGLATAPSGTGQFIYETDAAKLWWDADGAGAGASVAVATFTPGTVLSAADLHLIG